MHAKNPKKITYFSMIGFPVQAIDAPSEYTYVLPRLLSEKSGTHQAI
jgi:hypothetical protein